MSTQINSQANHSGNILLKVAAVLWVIWGVVHVLAGVMTISKDTPQAVQGIADAVDPETLDVVIDEPPQVGFDRTLFKRRVQGYQEVRDVHQFQAWDRPSFLASTH